MVITAVNVNMRIYIYILIVPILNKMDRKRKQILINYLIDLKPIQNFTFNHCNKKI